MGAFGREINLIDPNALSIEGWVVARKLGIGRMWFWRGWVEGGVRRMGS